MPQSILFAKKHSEKSSEKEETTNNLRTSLEWLLRGTFLY